MLHKVVIVGLVAVPVASFAFNSQGDPGSPDLEEFRANTRLPIDVASEAPSGVPSPLPEPEISPERAPELMGASLAAITATLAAQLRLDESSAWVVVDVPEGSSAAQAGLEAHDVVTRIEDQGQVVEVDSLANVEDAALAVHVLRGGMAHVLTIDGELEPEGGSGFLSVASLPADHPMRQLDALRELRENTSTRAAEFSERMQSLEDETRSTREAAREAVAALQEQGSAQVAEYLGNRREALLAKLDRVLPEDRTEALHGLGTDLREVLPDDRMAAVTTAYGESRVALERLAEDLLGEQGDEDETPRRQRQLVQRVSQHSTSLFDRRVGPRWTEALSSLSSHREGYAEHYAGRMQWTDEMYAKLRAELRERVECAFDRSQAELDKQLARRLGKMNLPRPGELEGCLEDVCDQIDRMLVRFARRTELAFEPFAEATARETEALRAVAGEVPGAAATAASSLERAVGEALTHARAALPGDLTDSWRTGHSLLVLNDELDGELRAALIVARRATRDATQALDRAFDEHEAATDVAWQDLERLLGALAGEAAQSCWKLDGPHLDGRFPAQPEAVEQEESGAGEVALAR